MLKDCLFLRREISTSFMSIESVVSICSSKEIRQVCLRNVSWDLVIKKEPTAISSCASGSFFRSSSSSSSSNASSSPAPPGLSKSKSYERITIISIFTHQTRSEYHHQHHQVDHHLPNHHPHHLHQHP